MNEITVIRGDDDTIGVTFTDSTGTVIDITGYTVFFTVKNTVDLDRINDDCALIQKTVTSHPDPTNGETTISLTKTDTDLAEGTYSYDLQVKNIAGSISTVVPGDFIVITDVTRRTT